MRWLVLGMVVVALLSSGLLHGEVLVGRDLLAQFYPRCAVIGASLAAGEIPRWNPYCGNGAPWFGPRAGGVLYPGYLLFAALPLAHAMWLFIALHYLLALEGTRRLMRSVCLPSAAVVGGLCYAVGGFMASQYWDLPYLVSGAWLPWAALAGRRIDRPWLAIGLGGSAVGLCFLVGEPQGALIAAAAMAVCAVANRGQLRAAILCVAVATAIGVAIGAPQVLSILDELPATNRTLGVWSDTRWGLAPTAAVVDLLAPGALGGRTARWGSYWGNAYWGGELPWCGLTVGALGAGLVLVALLRRAPAAMYRSRSVAIVLSAGGILLSATGAGRFLGLRFESKWLVLTGLGLAMLSGIGCDRWLRARQPALGVFLSCLLALCALLGCFVLLGGSGVEQWFEAQNPGRVVGSAAQCATSWALLRAAVFAALGLAICLRRHRLSRASMAALAVGVVCGDLLSAAKPGIETAPSTVLRSPSLLAELRMRTASLSPAPPVRLDSNTGLTDWLRYETQPFPAGVDRHAFIYQLWGDSLAPNLSYRYGVRVIPPFESVRTIAFLRITRDPQFAGLPRSRKETLIGAEWSLLTHSQAASLSADSGLEILGPIGRLTLARVLSCPPWAEFATEAVYVADLDEAATALVVPTRPLRPILGPEGVASPPPSPAGPPATAEIRLVEYTPERIQLQVRTRQAGWLILQEAYSEEWRATIDDETVPTARANMFFRAVSVPEGEHRVEFAYEPWWWDPSLRLFAFGWLVTALAALAAFRGSRPSPPSPLPGKR